MAYFAFANVQGSQSAPCFAPTAFGSCSSDGNRPGFLQFGNTLEPLRNILVDPSNPGGPAPECYGLAIRFGVLDVHGRVAMHNFDPVTLAIEGDYIKNLAYNRSSVALRAANNTGNNNFYQGGDSGYQVAISGGHEKFVKLWDWNVTAAYKYLATDATVDALADSHFHLGGTNAKGYTVQADLALDANAWLSVKWLSATQVSGAPYAEDTLYVDVNGAF